MPMLMLILMLMLMLPSLPPIQSAPAMYGMLEIVVARTVAQSMARPVRLLLMLWIT